MKVKFIFIFILLIACSKDDENFSQNIDSLSLEKNYGIEEETIYLYSKDFKNYNNYSIKIGDYDCSILEITETSIKFQIPKECKSGNLTLNYNETSLNIEFFKILEDRMFAFKSTTSSPKKIDIYELEIYSGIILNHIEIPTDFELTYSSFLSQVSSSINNIVCLINDNRQKQYLLDYNINSRESQIIELNQNYSEILTNENGEVFTHTKGDNNLYKINTLNGEILDTVQIPEDVYVFDWLFDEIEQKIILSTRKEEMFGAYSENTTFYKISFDNEEIKLFNTSQDYSHIALSLDGKLFANNYSQKKIIQLNKDTFEQNNFSINYGKLGGGWKLSYLNSTSEFIGTYTETCTQRFCDSYISVFDSNSNLISDFLWNDFGLNAYSHYIITKFK